LSVSLLLLASAPALADLDDVREELTRNIQASQRELTAAQASIGRERGELAQRLLAAQNRVLSLRERAVAARRLADEETLTLRQIETRLEAWREQSRFQSNLLAGFLDRTGRRLLSEPGEIDLRTDLAILATHLDAQEARLYPSWQKGRVVLPEGEIADGDVLTVGPVAWFRRAEPEQSGLIRRDANLTRVSLLFDGSRSIRRCRARCSSPRITRLCGCTCSAAAFGSFRSCCSHCSPPGRRPRRPYGSTGCPRRCPRWRNACNPRSAAETRRYAR
jgi:biopolymer transport protein ExbB